MSTDEEIDYSDSPTSEPGLLEALYPISHAAALKAERAAGWREAIEALRTGEAWKAAQQALADEWHEDDCHCDAWPEDCRTHPRNTWASGRDFAPSSWHPETVAPYFAAFLESLAPKETP